MNRISIYSTVNNLSCADGPNDGSIDVTIDGTVGAYLYLGVMVQPLRIFLV